jgi:hypothetical protein
VPHAYTEDPLVEQPAIGLFAELGWYHRRRRDLLLPHLLSGQAVFASVSANGAPLCQPGAAPQVSRRKYQEG